MEYGPSWVNGNRNASRVKSAEQEIIESRVIILRKIDINLVLVSGGFRGLLNLIFCGKHKSSFFEERLVDLVGLISANTQNVACYLL